MPSELASAAPSGTSLPFPRVFDATRDPGPSTAQLAHRVYAAVLLAAWLSLGRQVLLLIGERGLLPAGETLQRARAAGASLFDLPTPFWLGHGDGVLLAGTVLGGALSIAILLGRWPRTCLLISAPLYLGYCAVAQDFLAFQWDNLLVESALLLACLSPRAPSRLAWLALRVLLFKLYFESGIAKWQSHLHDWHDGSAMTFYFETAPLPAGLSWYAHQLPQRLLELSSWGALLLELPLPFLVFGPRRARLVVFFALTSFQLINTLTANYGFFTYMSAALHVCLLCEADVVRLTRWRARAAPTPAPDPFGALTAWRALGPIGFAAWLTMSAIGAQLAFGEVAEQSVLRGLHALYAPLRVANTYHLFGHITRERIEPQLELLVDGAWREQDLRYKPGDPRRRPPYVAPHQPRVDFRLWFYGLSLQRPMPRYVRTLLERLCDEPEVVQPLFSAALPEQPEAVRVAAYRYHFTTPAERAESGAFWRRERLGELPARSCR